MDVLGMSPPSVGPVYAGINQKTQAEITGSGSLLITPQTDISLWFNNYEYSNMTFVVEGQKFYAHSEIIKSRCPYFYALMEGNIFTYDGFYVDVDIRDCSAEIFGIILKYIYTERADINAENMWQIYDAAKNYQLETLRVKARDFILSKVHFDNVWEFIDTATNFEADEIVDKLRSFAQSCYKEATTTRPGSNRPAGPGGRYYPDDGMNYPPAYNEHDNSYSQYASNKLNLSTGSAPKPIQMPMGQPQLAPQPIHTSQYPPHYSTPPFYDSTTSPGAGAPPSAAPAPAPKQTITIPAPQDKQDSHKTKREWTMEHLNYLGEMVRVLLEADRISLFLYSEETKELCAVMNNSCEIRIPYNLGVAGAVFTSGKTINVKDPYNDSRFLSDVDKQTGYITTSLLCMPISGNRGCIGVIELLNKKPTSGSTTFSEDDEKTLNTVCHLAGSLLDKVSDMYSSENPSKPNAAPMITNDAHIRSLNRLSIQQQTETKPEPATLVANASTLLEDSKKAGNKRTKGEINWHRYKRGRKNSIPVFHFRISNSNSSSASTK